MEALLAPMITGGASLLGSIFNANTSAQNSQNQMLMQAQAETFNAGQAEQNREFQNFESSSAYQRATADMQKAGLNPAMMFGSGGPASTPGGATGSISPASLPPRTSPLAGLGQAAQIGMSTAVQQKEMDLVSERSAAQKLDNEDAARLLKAGRPEAAVRLLEGQTGSATSQTTLNEQMLTIRAYEEMTGKLFKSLDPSLQKALIAGDKGLDAAGRVVDMAPGVRMLRGLGTGGGAVPQKNSAVSPGEPQINPLMPGGDAKSGATANRKRMVPGNTFEEMWKNRVSSDKPYPY